MDKAVIEDMQELPYALEEAVNRLRINIGFTGKDVRKIMVVSTLPNEGKSFVALHLWKQMASVGVRSVLVDVDMRKSVIVKKYGIHREDGGRMCGTSHYLAGDCSLEEVLLHTDMEQGDILPNVDNVVNPSMLIESGHFKEMLEHLARQYRYVFLDSPPLDLTSDGEKIGSMCDGAILVVRGGGVSRRMVKNSVQQIGRSGCPLLGIVLNRTGGANGGYYGYGRYGKRYYGKYYGKYGGKYGGYYGNEYYGGDKELLSDK